MSDILREMDFYASTEETLAYIRQFPVKERYTDFGVQELCRASGLSLGELLSVLMDIAMDAASEQKRLNSGNRE